MERSWKVALPAPPPPPPVPMVPVFVTPQEYDSTSTSSLCLLSLESPLMSTIFARMSVAMDAPEQSVVRLADHECSEAVETAIFCESTAGVQSVYGRVDENALRPTGFRLSSHAAKLAQTA